MILLLDIGNTRIKWARLVDGRLSAETPVMHRGRDVALMLSGLWHDLPPPRRMVAACVAGESLRTALAAWCLEHWGVRPEYLVAALEACGIRNGYRLPDQLGVDRWLSMIGARQLPAASGQPLCVVGCGTALTVDVLSVTGQHLGGWIAPGVGLMRQQLEQGTAVFADGVARTVVEDDFAHDSMSGVATGTAQAAAGMVVQAMSLVRQRYGISPVCVLTGGDADMLQPLLPMPVQVRPELVLSGMAVLLDEEGRYSP